MPPTTHATNVFRPYRKGDLKRVWQSLRSEDLRELSTGGHFDPTIMEHLMLLAASDIRTWDTEIGPVAVLGVTLTENPDVGLVWALASTLAEPRWRFAVRHTPALLDELGRGFKVLANFKDTRNTRQINWLRKVGFTFINEHEGQGATYLEFVRIVK